ncbi:MAG: putative toxin-antitoxin system toxin component, PIN family [Muribaculaceae bacterium]|nr:putative toxin-antitoxin system toxin component, PIN family [Muribaculaceae bacterium]
MKEDKAVYAVIDTNVLVSSLFSGNGQSNPARVIRAVLSGVITPLYSNEIIEEYRDVLSRDKFKFKDEHIEALISAFTDFGINTVRTRVVDEVFPDIDDIVFYEVTMSVDNAYLITGNAKHFPRKPFVVTPAQMVEILQEKRLLDM